ncbi:MobF family relaxase [Nocardioides hwasunensis]|uniref:MobF family relaxase n=1 Tax=Nocardioides hwasunensis TaxID=397258 RepID=UPI002963F0E0|nr:MobF family relaxase [Nocardioides hwasunensis]
MKFYRGTPKAARTYVEQDCARYDDYYLAEGAGIAMRFAAARSPDGLSKVARRPDLDGAAYEAWVAGVDVESGEPKGRLRTDASALRFVEVTINGPKTWSLAAALRPEVSTALDAAQDRAAEQIIGYLAEHATTRIGPRGRQVQIPVEQLEAAAIRHYTSRAGDPHRHLHLQVNARVFAAGQWRGLHSVGVRDMIEAINGIGHAAVATDPEFRTALADAGFTLDLASGEVKELEQFSGAFSARSAQIRANVDRYEAGWRSDHPGQEPGPQLREVWDRRAWAEARPDKVVPKDGAQVIEGWNEDLRALGYRGPAAALPLRSASISELDRDRAAELVLSRLGAKRSAWNTADIRGQVENLIAQSGVVAAAGVRIELAEDITARAAARCRPLLLRPDVPEHVRALTSPDVLAVETQILERLMRRAQPAEHSRMPRQTLARLGPDQARVVAALTGRGALVVVEGPAGAGKTTTLSAVSAHLARHGHRLMVVTPTRKAADVASRETGGAAQSAAWLIHQYGWRWDDDGHWSRQPSRQSGLPSPEARLRRGDLLLVDEAGMVTQDDALALLTLADEAGARIAFLGDRHQLPAVGRGGVLDHVLAWAHPSAALTLEQVHRFTDPDYAQISLRMRDGRDPDAFFDQLLKRGQIAVHASEAERTAALAEVGATGKLVVADTREQVAALNAAISYKRTHGPAHQSAAGMVITRRGEQLRVGARVATRRNDPALGVTNRQTWTVTRVSEAGDLVVHSPELYYDRQLPAAFVRDHVELAYATTIHGAQGETVDHAHVAIAESTGAAATYVAMTRGRESNVAHLVAATLDEARQQWSQVFDRDRADLGPAHMQRAALDAIDRCGPHSPRPAGQPSPYDYTSPTATRSAGIGL